MQVSCKFLRMNLVVQLLFTPQSCTKKTTLFFAGASVPNGDSASPTMQSEVAQKVIYTPDYWRQAGKQYINNKKKFYQHFKSAYSQNLKFQFLNETYRTIFGWETPLSSTQPHKGLFHILKGLSRSQTTQ